MPQLRRDPVGGRWVIISTERAARPGDLTCEDQECRGGFCPFCEGHEGKTPSEVLSFRDPDTEADEAGWRVRVVPNKYPALKAEGVLEEDKGDGIFHTMSGLGQHEVFIEGAQHHLSLSELPRSTVEEVVDAYRQRMLVHKSDKRMVYALIFKNVGRRAGASLEHSHSQLICTPVVPKRVGEEMDRCEEFYQFQDECLMCSTLDEEVNEGTRIVVEREHFVALTPYASRFPFEMWVVPRQHMCHYEEMPEHLLGEFAGVLHEAICRLDVAMDRPPYNYVLHTTPFTIGEVDHFHWHLEIIPRVTHVAGFEWGTGFYINPVRPADAAQCLRNVVPGEQGMELNARTEAGL